MDAELAADVDQPQDGDVSTAPIAPTASRQRRRILSMRRSSKTAVKSVEVVSAAPRAMTPDCSSASSSGPSVSSSPKISEPAYAAASLRDNVHSAQRSSADESDEESAQHEVAAAEAQPEPPDAGAVQPPQRRPVPLDFGGELLLLHDVDENLYYIADEQVRAAAKDLRGSRQEPPGLMLHGVGASEDGDDETATDTADEASVFSRASEWSRSAWWGSYDDPEQPADVEEQSWGAAFDRREELRGLVSAFVDAVGVRSFVDKQAAFAAQTVESLHEKRVEAMALIQRQAQDKKRMVRETAAGAAGGVAAVRGKAADKVVVARDAVAERRESAQTVIRNAATRWRERRLQRRRAAGDFSGDGGAGGSRSFTRRPPSAMRRERTSREGVPSSALPTPQSLASGVALPPQMRLGQPTFSDEELRAATRMRADWGRPPSDHPSAKCVCERVEGRLKLWRWRGENGPTGTSVDEYMSEFEIPISVEAFVSMQMEIASRKFWDSTTKRIDVISAGGVNELQNIHGQTGDSMALCWLIEAPAWPLRDREYMIYRRVSKWVDEASSDLLYFRIDQTDDLAESWALCPRVERGATRCTDHRHAQLAWSAVSADGTRVVRVRSHYREDPQTMLPKIILNFITDTMLPRSLTTLRKSAVEHQKRSTARAKARARAEALATHAGPSFR